MTSPRPADDSSPRSLAAGAVSSSASRSQHRSSSKLMLVAGAAGVAFALDLASKVAIVATVSPQHRPVSVLGGAFYLVQARNSGAAFSVGTGATVALTALSVAVVIVIIRTARRLTSRGWALSLGLVLGGALGNLVDRFFRAPAPGRGHVVDWIALHTVAGYQYPIFNIADSCIVLGAILAFLLSLRGTELTPRLKTEPPDGAASPSLAGRSGLGSGGDAQVGPAHVGPASRGDESDQPLDSSAISDRPANDG